MDMLISSFWPGAAALGHKFPQCRILSDLLESVLARAGFGVIIATADRRIVYLNEVARVLTRARPGLNCEGNRIRVSDPSLSRKLQAGIMAVSRPVSSRTEGGSLVFRDEEGAAALAVHVIPLPLQFSQPLAHDTPAVGLIIMNCRRGSAERIRAFANLFALTPGEARVVSQLVLGEGLKATAARLKLAPSTVRSHLTRVLEKTGTRRQAELVKVFYEVTLPLDAHGGETADNSEILMSLPGRPIRPPSKRRRIRHTGSKPKPAVGPVLCTELPATGSSPEPLPPTAVILHLSSRQEQSRPREQPPHLR